jgi:hypothetical protein
VRVEAHGAMRIADRIWLAAALLHIGHSSRASFSKREILEKLEAEGLAAGVERGTLNAHLDQHLVANRSPSSGKYRMLFETSDGNLRLFQPGDYTHPARLQLRKPSKIVPRIQEIPQRYHDLLDWYTNWSRKSSRLQAPNYDDDPLIRLIGSGRHIWADEHADEYVENLRREDR